MEIKLHVANFIVVVVGWPANAQCVAISISGVFLIIFLMCSTKYCFGSGDDLCVVFVNAPMTKKTPCFLDVLFFVTEAFFT